VLTLNEVLHTFSGAESAMFNIKLQNPLNDNAQDF